MIQCLETYPNEIVGKLGIKNLSKGVKIEMFDGQVHVELSIIMKYSLQYSQNLFPDSGKVMSAVENMTGLKVVAINIKIEGVNAYIYDSYE